MDFMNATPTSEDSKLMCTLQSKAPESSAAFAAPAGWQTSRKMISRATGKPVLRDSCSEKRNELN